MCLSVYLPSGCRNSTGPGAEWYPSTIYGYTPYEVSLGGPVYPFPLNPGQTEFTQDEVVRYVEELIDQRQELIGADSESLRLVKVKNTYDNPQTWRLSYERSDAYKFRIVRYGTVSLTIVSGEVVLLVSRLIPVVPVPDEPIVSDDVIGESLIGEKLTYYDIGGNPIEYEVEEDAIVFGDLVIFPILRENTENTLEIRLCREVGVRGGNWSLFYDVITGEKIYVRCNIWS